MTSDLLTCVTQRTADVQVSVVDRRNEVFALMAEVPVVTQRTTLQHEIVTTTQPVDVQQVEIERHLISVGSQGPRGAVGGIDTLTPQDIGALAVANKLSELTIDSATQLTAQQNIGLGLVDPLAHYILAKS